MRFSRSGIEGFQIWKDTVLTDRALAKLNLGRAEEAARELEPLLERAIAGARKQKQIDKIQEALDKARSLRH